MCNNNKYSASERNPFIRNFPSNPFVIQPAILDSIVAETRELVEWHKFELIDINETLRNNRHSFPSWLKIP